MGFPFTLLIAAALSMYRNGTERVPCIKGFAPANASLRGVLSDHAEGSTWMEIDTLCQKSYPGWRMSTKVQAWTEEEIALCPVGSLVPLGIALVDGGLAWTDSLQRPLIDSELRVLHVNTSIQGILGALTWPTRNLTLFGANKRFACGVCQPESRNDVLTRAVTTPSRAVYDIVLRGSATPDAERLRTQLAAQLNVSIGALRWRGTRVDEVSSDEVLYHIFYEPPSSELLDWLPYLRWNEPDFRRPSVSDFEVVAISPSTMCFDPSKDGEIQGKPRLAGAVDAWEDLVRDVVVTRECRWNAVTETAAWTPQAAWKLQMMQDCGPGPANDDSPNGAANFHLMFVSALLESTSAGNELVTLETALLASERSLALLISARAALTFVGFDVAHALSKVFARAKLRSRTELHVTPRVVLLVAELNTTDPVTGITISKALGEKETRTHETFTATQLNRGNASLVRNESLLEVQMSDKISCCARRLAVAVFAAHSPSSDNADVFDAGMSPWIALVHVTFAVDELDPVNADKSDIFVDIQVGAEWSGARPSCAEYTDTRVWSRSSCSSRIFEGGQRGCRCAAKSASIYLILAGARALAPHACMLLFGALVSLLAARLRQFE